MLGASLALTNKLQMACELAACHRWVMTGTPTPSTPSSNVSHLQPLLAFLKQEPYGQSRSTWDVSVQRPFESKQWWGRERLMDVLNTYMLRYDHNERGMYENADKFQ